MTYFCALLDDKAKDKNQHGDNYVCISSAGLLVCDCSVVVKETPALQVLPF